MAVALALCAGAVAAVLLSSGGASTHTLRAEFDGAFGAFPGLNVRLAGRDVGEVESAQPVDGHAVLELRIDDARAWPLPRGTTARLRTGPVATLATRYVELNPGPRSAPPLPDGGVLTRANTISPVEFDDANRILTRRARGDLKGLIGNLADTVDGHERQLGRGLSAAAGGVDQTAAFLRELGADRAALATLAEAGARTSGAISARRRELGGLVANAAATFDELARRSRATTASLDRFAPTLRVTRRSLARVDRSLPGLSALLTDVRPGAVSLRRLAPVARRAISALRDVSPLATSALRRARHAAPPIRALLQAGAPFSDDLGAVLDQAAPILDCIRPYAPELAGVASTWTSFSSTYDATGHYMRSLVTAIPFGAGEPRSSKEIVDQSGGSVRYAWPAPPGLNVGQPWFQPQCGAGPTALDPAFDPEGAGR